MVPPCVARRVARRTAAVLWRELLGLAAVLWFVGFWALMRITRGERTVRSFRATRHRDPATLLLWAGAAAFLALAVVALVASAA